MANEMTTGKALKALADAQTLGVDELDYLDGVTPGTVTSSKALVVDENDAIGTIVTATITNATIAAATIAALTYATASRTATADGTGTGTIAAAGMLQFVTVAASNADHIIVLPAPTPGTIVILRNGATGYELRSSAPATVAINGGAEANAESAIAASTMVIAICTTATTWQAISLVGTTLAAVAAAAAA